MNRAEAFSDAASTALALWPKTDCMGGRLSVDDYATAEQLDRLEGLGIHVDDLERMKWALHAEASLLLRALQGRRKDKMGTWRQLTWLHENRAIDATAIDGLEVGKLISRERRDAMQDVTSGANDPEPRGITGVRRMLARCDSRRAAAEGGGRVNLTHP